MKKIFLVPLIAVFSLGALTVFRDVLLKSAVAGTLSKTSGAPVHIKNLSLSLVKSTLRLEGFEMGNPSGFPEGTLVSIPLIKITYDRPALFKKKIHILLAEIDLKEVVLVRNKEGLLNVDALEIVRAQRQSKKAEPIPFQIDALTLSIGKIVEKDYRGGPEPSVRVREMNIHKNYKMISSIEQLALLVLAEPVKAAGIQGAKIYGTMLLTGMAVLPVAAVFTFTSKDDARQIVQESFERAYAVSEKTLRRMGTVTGQNAAKGEIRANVRGAGIVVRLAKREDGQTEITVSARQFLLPRPEVAGGVLYEIEESMK